MFCFHQDFAALSCKQGGKALALTNSALRSREARPGVNKLAISSPLEMLFVKVIQEKKTAV